MLSFSQFSTLFHEFGHALNIALSDTKYQYLSGARSGQDVCELPSYFAEKFLRDYSFLMRFAKAEQTGAPLDKTVFRRMLFMEELFRFQSFEETLANSAMDLDFHSKPI